MTSYRRWSTAITSAIWLVLTAAIWIAFAPIQMGGSLAYVIVNGNSMEPNFHIGDLVIVRPTAFLQYRRPGRLSEPEPGKQRLSSHRRPGA